MAGVLRDAVGEPANLSGWDLSGLNLSGMDLRGVNLQGAVLKGADLSGADLSGSNLDVAIMRGASQPLKTVAVEGMDAPEVERRLLP